MKRSIRDGRDPGSGGSSPRDVYWFNAGYYTQAQLNADWVSFGWNVFLTIPFNKLR
jgi:hypothetical protein